MTNLFGPPDLTAPIQVTPMGITYCDRGYNSFTSKQWRKIERRIRNAGGDDYYISLAHRWPTGIDLVAAIDGAVSKSISRFRSCKSALNWSGFIEPVIYLEPTAILAPRTNTLANGFYDQVANEIHVAVFTFIPNEYIWSALDLGQGGDAGITWEHDNALATYLGIPAEINGQHPSDWPCSYF